MAASIDVLMELHFLGLWIFNIRSLKFAENRSFCGISRIFLEISASDKYFSRSGKWPFHTQAIHTPTKRRPNYYRALTKGGFPKGWFWRMFPRNEDRNEGTFGCSPRMKTGTRVHSHHPLERKPERGYIRQNHLLQNRPKLSKVRFPRSWNGMPILGAGARKMRVRSSLCVCVCSCSCVCVPPLLP